MVAEGCPISLERGAESWQLLGVKEAPSQRQRSWNWIAEGGSVASLHASLVCYQAIKFPYAVFEYVPGQDCGILRSVTVILRSVTVGNLE